MRPIFKTEMLIYQSKAKLDVKILFGKITHHLDPEIMKMLKRVSFFVTPGVNLEIPSAFAH